MLATMNPMTTMATVAWNDGMTLAPQHFQVQEECLLSSMHMATAGFWPGHWGLSQALGGLDAAQSIVRFDLLEGVAQSGWQFRLGESASRIGARVELPAKPSAVGAWGLWMQPSNHWVQSMRRVVGWAEGMPTRDVPLRECRMDWHWLALGQKVEGAIQVLQVQWDGLCWCADPDWLAEVTRCDATPAWRAWLAWLQQQLEHLGKSPGFEPCLRLAGQIQGLSVMHPCFLFCEIMGLLGVYNLPATREWGRYDHADPTSFARWCRLHLQSLQGANTTRECLELVLARMGQGLWSGGLAASVEKFRRGATLHWRSKQSSVRSLDWRQVRLAPVSELPRLVRAALPGVALQVSADATSAVIDGKDPLWIKVLEEGSVGVHCVGIEEGEGFILKECV